METTRSFGSTVPIMTVFNSPSMMKYKVSMQASVKELRADLKKSEVKPDSLDNNKILCDRYKLALKLKNDRIHRRTQAFVRASFVHSGAVWRGRRASE